MDSNTTEKKEQEINIQEIIKPYFRNWIWFIISTIIALCLVYLYLKATVPTYNIKSTVLIKEAKKSGGLS